MKLPVACCQSADLTKAVDCGLQNGNYGLPTTFKNNFYFRVFGRIFRQRTC